MAELLTKNSPTKIIAWANINGNNFPLPKKLLHIFIRIFLITITEFKKNDLSVRASALTYTILLSLVPMLAMSTAVMKGLGGGDQLQEVVYGYVQTLQTTANEKNNTGSKEAPQTQSPTASIPEHLNTALDKLFNYVEKTNFATLGTIGVLGMLVSVVLVFGNIEKAMNTIWHIESGRSIIRKIADYLALLVLLPISINVGFAAGAVVTSDFLLSKVGDILPSLLIQTLILKLIPIFFLSLSLVVMYLFFPNTKVKTLPALIGALIAGLFWFEAQSIYISLQVGVARYNAIYGSFATLPLFLVWMYFGWVFILAGAQIAFSCQNFKTYQLLQQPSMPSQRLAAAHDILTLVQDSFDIDRSVSMQDIQQKFPNYQPSLLAETTELLIAGDILYIMDEKNKILPTSSLKNILPEKIITTILGTCTTETDGGRASYLALEAAAKAFRLSPGK